MSIDRIKAHAQACLELDDKVVLDERQWREICTTIERITLGSVKLRDNLHAMVRKFGHYGYSRENRDTVDGARAALADAEAFLRETDAKV